MVAEQSKEFGVNLFVLLIPVIFFVGQDVFCSISLFLVKQQIMHWICSTFNTDLI